MKSTTDSPVSDDAACSDSRFENQGQTLANIIENIEFGKYGFTGGKHQFSEWKKRAMQSASNGERQALLIEADRLMQETKTRSVEKHEPTRRKWKFW